MKNNFKKSFEEGTQAEEFIEKHLVKQGYIILPMSQFDDSKSHPSMFDENNKYITPDIICFKSGSMLFIDVKLKKQWVTGYNGIETGIDQHSYDQYMTLSEKLNIPCDIIFVHPPTKENEKIEGGVGVYKVNINTNKNIRKWEGTIFHKPEVFWQKQNLEIVKIERK